LHPFDQAGHFQGLRDNSEMSRLAVRSAGITISAQGCVFAIQMLGTIILARLLTPADFGIVTMVTTFSLLFASYGLAGLTDAILQTDSIDHSLASNLFWINLAGGVILAAVFAASGSLLSRFYNNPQITEVAIGFSLVIFFSIVPVVHLSLLKRAMWFGATSGNDIFGRIAYVAAAIFCAWLGWGYWALVAGAVIQALSQCIGAWLLCRWCPSLPKPMKNTGTMVRYAMNVYGRFSLNYGTGNADNILVGWRFGAPALGYYKKAFDLFVLPSCQLLSPILAVVVTALSRKNKDKEEFKRYFLKALCVVAFVGMAASAYFTLIGRDLVRLLLGPTWKESGRIFTYFAPGIGLMLVYQTTAWIHLSLGTTARWLRWAVVELTVTGILFLLAMRWGPAGIAGAWTASFVFLMVPGFWYAGKPIQLRTTTVIESIWRYAASALIAGLLSAQIVGYLKWLPLAATIGIAGAIARILINSFLFTLLYLLAIAVLFKGIEPMRQIARLLPDLLPTISFRRQDQSARDSKQRTNLQTSKLTAQEVTFEGK
jgi:PST family polysaccharide transporter